MIDQLTTLDNEILLLVNGAHSEGLDQFMSIVSEKWTWVPFYILALLGLWKALGQKAFWISLPVIALMIGLSDWGSVNFFKEQFQRYRPCHNDELKELVHLVDGKCGGLYGFVSSHAANHFAIAMFLFSTLGRSWSWVKPTVVVWACLIALSRVYLGVHYPSDVAIGGLYGILVGMLAAVVLDRMVLRRNLKP